MEKEAIILIGGGLKEENGLWRTTNFEEGDNFGAMGDRLRVEAVAVLSNKNLEARVFVLGGKGQNKDNPIAPTVASVNASELQTLGVSPDRIILEENSNNTWQQLKELGDILEKEKENFSQVYLVSNKWQIPRIKVMSEKNGSIRHHKALEKIQFLNAEDILIEEDKEKWEALIEEAYATEGMEKRISLENKGIEDIRTGKYILN